MKKADFQQPVKNQGKNFDHFIRFLNKNNLDHIYKEQLVPARVPFDKKLSEIQLLPPISPINSSSLEEMVQRWENYNLQLENSNKTLKKELVEKDKKIRKYQGTLNRKSVRLALKTANMLSLK